MKKIMVALMCLPILSWPLQAAPDTAAFVEKLANTISAVQTVRLEGVWTIEVEMEGMKQKTEMPMKLVYERPNRLSLISQQSQVMCDGQQLVQRMPMLKRYQAQPLGEGGLAEALEDSLLGASMVSSPLARALISGKALEVLSEYAEDNEVLLLPDEERFGAPCHVVKVVARVPGSEEGLTFKAWIDQAAGLLRRVELDREALAAAVESSAEADAEGGADMLDMLNNMQITYEAKSLELNGAVSDEDFVFAPPPGDKKVDDLLEDAGGRSSGADTFELSGQTAPDFTIELLDESSLTLSEAGKDKVVVLDFWATWCGPCMRALPHMAELSTTFADKEVLFVGLSRDDPSQKDNVRKTLEKHGASYPCGLADEELAEAYGVRGIPCLILIGRDGKVAGRHVGFSPGLQNQLASEIEELLEGHSAALKPVKERKAHTRRYEETPTVLNEKFFTVTWSVDLKPGAGLNRDNDAVRAAMPASRLVAVVDDGNLRVLKREDGREMAAIPLSEECLAKNEMNQDPLFQVLKTADGFRVVGLQKLYRVEEKGEKSRSYRPRKLMIYGLDTQGATVWTYLFSLSDSVRRLGVLPMNSDEDILLAERWNGFSLFNERGELLLEQALSFREHLEWSKTESGLEVLVFSPQKVTCYSVSF